MRNLHSSHTLGCSGNWKELYMNVGSMKDEKFKLKDLHVSHTLGSRDSCLFCLLLIDKGRVKDKTYIYECRCDERLKTKTEDSTRLTYTGLRG